MKHEDIIFLDRSQQKQYFNINKNWIKSLATKNPKRKEKRVMQFVEHYKNNELFNINFKPTYILEPKLFSAEFKNTNLLHVHPIISFLDQHTRIHNYDMINYLLKNGVDINSFSYFERTALMEVIDFDYFDGELIQFLIDKGSDVNICNRDNMTPLMKASLSKYGNSIAALLLENGADINKRLVEISRATRQVYDKYTVLDFIYKKDRDLGQFIDSYVQNKIIGKNLDKLNKIPRKRKIL